MADYQAKRRRLDNTRDGSQTFDKSYGDVSTDRMGHLHQGDINNTKIYHHYYNPKGDHPTDDAQVDQCNELVESLLFERMEARYHNVSPILPNTCAWLFRHSQFVNWMDDQNLDHSGFLWIKGKPGCGKSSIMKNTLRYVTRKTRSTSVPWTILSYFFNARANGHLEKSSLGLYRSITHSLVTSSPQLRPLFQRTFHWKLKGDAIDEWTSEELQNFLIEVVEMQDPICNPICIFIDALDEGDENDIRAMITFLDDLARCAAHNKQTLRICFSSRHYPHITIPRGLSLTVEDEADHDQDIQLYIRQRLAEATDSRMQELCEQVYKKSAHVFLWVVLVIPMLNSVHCDGGSVKDMGARLDEIPADLDGLFADILARSSKDLNKCICLLQWVLFSFRPLKAPELYLAIHSSLQSDSSSRIESSASVLHDAKALNRILLNYSRGLVELTRAKPPIVQFIHETVRHFLSSPKGLAQLDTTLSANAEGLSHDLLKRGCFTYVETCQRPANYRSESEKQLSFMTRLADDFPFMRYALSSAYDHADRAQALSVSQLDFLRSRKDDSGCWQETHFMLWRNDIQHLGTRKYYPGDQISLVYFLADQNLPHLLEASMALKVDVNRCCGRYGNALQAACRIGNLDMVKVLLQKGANANAEGGEYEHALVAAVLNENYAIVTLLRDYNANPSQVLLDKTLMTATSRNLVEAIKTTIDFGASLNCRNRRNENPLEIAVSKGRRETVDLLLNYATNPGLEGAIFIASNSGDKELIKTLLVHVVRSRLDLEIGSPLLKRAALQSPIAALTESKYLSRNLHLIDAYSALIFEIVKLQDLETLQLLLDDKVNLSIRLKCTLQGEEFVGDVLQLALRLDRLDIGYALLSHGANENGIPGNAGTAAEIAALSKDDKALELLLQFGLRLETYEHKHLLTYAVKNDKIGRAKFLLNKAIQSSCVDWLAGPDIWKSIVSYSSPQSVVQFLDVCAHDRPSMLVNALHEVAMCQKPQFIAEILQRGVDIDTLNSDGESALHIAIRSRRPENVEMLLQHGANVNMRDMKSQTPLYKSCVLYYTDITKLLIHHGASVDAASPFSHCESLLAFEASAGRHENVNILLRAGANVNACCDCAESHSPLVAATKYGSLSIVEALIRAGAGISSHGVDEKMWSQALDEAYRTRLPWFKNRAIDVLLAARERARQKFQAGGEADQLADVLEN